MNSSEQFSQLDEVMHALKRYAVEDEVGAGALGLSANEYVLERLGCSDEDINTGMPKENGERNTDPYYSICFEAWYEYMREGLKERGYLGPKKGAA